MRRILLIASLAIAGVALRAGAALQFVGVPSTTSGTLNAATCDPNSSFVAVGTNSSVLTGTFATDHIAWSSNGVPLATSLLSATFGNGIFLAGTTGGNVVSSTNGLTWGSQTSPFTNFTAYVSGLAFNPRTTSNPNFVAAPQLFEIAYSRASLPLAWVGATINSFNLGESWRAVAPFGVSNFIACGFQGDIRYSTNNGTSWFLSRVPNSSFPDLLGIASDGTNRIVAVGNLGTILFSSNGGTTWSAAASPAAGGTNLYAVAWDDANQQFMAVGNSGVVMTSANGTSWTLQNLGVNQALYGVTAANTGILAGVSFLVGNNGRAWLAGTPPAAPIDPVSQTNCAVPVQSKALQVTVVPDTAHPAGSVGVDWYNSSGVRVFVNSPSFVPTNTFAPPNAPATYIYYAVTRDLRTGFTNTTPVAVNLTIDPRPTATLSTSTITNCNIGTTYILTNTLTGLGPWTIWWNDGFIQSNPTVGPGPVLLTRTIVPTNTDLNIPSNNVFYVTIVSNADTCLGNLPGDITGTNQFWVNPRPTATLLSFSQTNCNIGTTYTLTNTLTGVGPWTVWWNDGFVQTLSTAGSGPATFTRIIVPTNTDLNIPSNNVFSVAIVSNADTCLGNFPGDITGSVSIRINPRPTASLLSFNVTNCNIGTPFTLTNTLTGQGPWTVSWSDGVIQTNPATGPGPAILTRVIVPTNTDLNIPSNNVFTITTVSDADSCVGNFAGDITGSVSVRVNPRPTATLVSFTTTNCNISTAYTLTNTLTGQGPWMVWWNDGFVQTNTTIGAGPVLLTRTIIPTNTDLNIPSNNIFSVTIVSNADTCLGNFAGDITGSVTVRINPRPTASFTSVTVTNCNLGTAQIITNKLQGQGPWTVWWNDGVIQTESTAGAGPVQLTRTVIPTNTDLNFPSNNTFFVTIVSNADTCLGNHPGDIAGTANFWVNPRPTALLTSLLTTNCNIGTSYTLTNTLTGRGPWTIWWNDNFIQTDSSTGPGPVQLTRLVVPTNTAPDTASNNTFYVTVISNLDTCMSVQPGDLGGSASIWINPRPTAAVALTTSPTNCSYTVSNAVIRATLHGIAPWIVYWSDGTIQTNSTGLADYPTGKLTNIYSDVITNFTLWVTNLTDQHCMALAGDLTGTATLTVYPTPSAVVSGTTTICNGQPSGVHAALHGIGPTWTVFWSDGTPQPNVANPATYPRILTNIYADVATNYTLWITNLDDNGFGCTTSSSNYLTGFASVTVNPRPAAQLLPNTVQTNCNDGTSFTLTNILHGLGPWTIWWNDGSLQTYSVATNGPVALTRTVFPTNGPGANVPSNNIYYVTIVSNADFCLGNLPGDITGTNSIWVNPRPTTTLTIGTNDFACSANGTNLLVSVIQSGTNFQVRTRFSYAVTNYAGGSGTIKSITNVLLPSATLYVTNHASFTGISSWTAAWQSAAFDTAGNPTGTADFTNTYAPATATHVWALTISNSTPGTNFTFAIIDLTDAHCNAGSAGLPAGIHVVVNGTLSANVYLTGGDTVCSGSSAAVTVDLGGKPPWTLLWNDGTTNTATSTPFERLVNPTNYLVNLPTNYSFWITNLSDSTPASTSSSNDLTGVASLTVDPVPVYPPEPVGTNFYVSCTNVQLTLSVIVTNGFTADWFADPGRSVLLLPGSTSFITPVINLGANTALTNTYYVAARFNDTNYEACVSTNLTQFTLVSQPCTNQLFIVNSGTNHGTIQWYGNFVLQAATNLAPPVVWTPVWTGSVAPNSFSWSNPPPVQYFRLYAPTN